MTPLILKAGQYREPDAPSAETLLQPLEGRSGYVFGFWSVRPSKEPTEAFSGVLQDHLLRLAAGFGARANAQYRFEQFLRALNEALTEQVRDGAWDVPIQNVHALVGVACEGQIFFSGTGDLSALYLHHRAGGPYQVYNLFRGIQTEQALPSWEKPFAVVLDGDLHPGDALCVSNHDLKRTLPADDLNRYLSSLPPASAAEKIRQHFPARTDLSLLILQAVDASPFAPGRAVPRTDVSIERLSGTEARTEQLLEDQGPHFLAALRDRFARRGAGAPAGVKRPFSVRLISLSKTALRATLSLFSQAIRAVRRLSRFRDRHELTRALETQAAGFKEQTLGRFRRIPRSSRYLLVAAAVLLIALVIGIQAVSRTQASAKAQAAYQSQVATIKDRRDQAAAALIYRDQQKAQALYEEANRLLTQLPTDTPARAAQAASLASDVNAGLDEIRHVVNIPNPPLAADLLALGGNVTGTALLQDGTTLYAFGSDKRIYRYDAAGKSFTRLDTTSGTVGTALDATSEGGTDLFLDDRPGVSSFDPAHLQEQVTDLQPAAGTSWADIVLYEKKLYALAPDANGGQVLRFSKTDTGYGPPANWIKGGNASLANAVGFAIDGTVFVLKADGTIARFVTGNETGWTAEKVNPPVTAATRIWTDTNSTYIYVLEPANKRLIVYAKQTGAFVAQYRSDAFDHLTDFSVDEKNRLIYLLNGSKLFAITASHLQ